MDPKISIWEEDKTVIPSSDATAHGCAIASAAFALGHLPSSITLKAQTQALRSMIWCATGPVTGHWAAVSPCRVRSWQSGEDLSFKPQKVYPRYKKTWKHWERKSASQQWLTGWHKRKTRIFLDKKTLSDMLCQIISRIQLRSSCSISERYDASDKEVLPVHTGKQHCPSYKALKRTHLKNCIRFLSFTRTKII